MTRTTIDFGIDLGTTNSEIAVLNGIRAEIIKNNENAEFTPSAVWIDHKNRLYVGQRAKERIEVDPENSFCEFKRKMGTNEQFTFQQTGNKMSAPELSAEVLKALRANVRQRLNGEEVTAAVITVPADFELPQTNATTEAAKLAGFDASPLLQEPIAAALAYGFQSREDNVFWCVYDFGGGTFDVTLIQLRDGIFQVVGHGGDKFLGGKDIDWEIVNKLFVPQLLKETKLTNFERGNRQWNGVFAKLKLAAEEAKIRLSNEDSVSVYIDQLVRDLGYDFELELKRSDIIPIVEPFIRRTIESCKKVIAESNLNHQDVEKTLLVGGPTLAPYLREMLMDAKQGLQIPLEFSIDPFTVVAQGAAIFAGTQRYEHSVFAPSVPNQVSLQLEYQPIGADDEPIVGGKILDAGQEKNSDLVIEITKQNGESKGWSSGKVRVGENGAFSVFLHAEKNIQNEYKVLVYNPQGTLLSAVPDLIKYTIGNAPTNQPLIHSMGIALSNNEISRYFEKGKELPARKIDKLRTTVDLRKGSNDYALNIPVIEGENLRANRNRCIGYLKIDGVSIKRDVPIGSEVEVTITIDQSRQIYVNAFLPLLDEEFEQIIKLDTVIPEVKVMKADLDDEKKRIETLSENARNASENACLAKLDQIETGNEMQRIKALLKLAANDFESANECQQRIIEMKISLDEIEDKLDWPAQVQKANEAISLANEIVEEYGNDKAKQLQSKLEVEINHAIQKQLSDVLKQKIDEMDNLRFAILRGKPDFWYGFVDYLEENKAKMQNQAAANQWLAEAKQARENQNLERVKNAVNNLLDLLPDNEHQARDFGFGSTLMR